MTETKKNPVLSTLSQADAARELVTLCDFVRYGVSLFRESGAFFGHGADNAQDEAIYMVLEGLHLPIDTIEPYWNAKLTEGERRRIASLLHRRVETRLPAAYILNKSYIQGFPFYVDERVLVPRSFIAEILCREDGFSRVPDYAAPMRVLDLCTGSGCLGIIAAHIFPNASVDIADLSPDALAVARRNVRDHGLEHRIGVHEGDLFAAVPGSTYDLIITNPPYVDRAGMENLPAEFRHEPAMALGAGDDGLEIVRRILDGAAAHLNEGGGILCEVGRCGPDLEAAFPRTPFLWIDTENSSGEIFWLEKEDL